MNTLWFSLAASLAALALVLCFAILMHWGYHREKGLLPYVFYQMVAVLVLTTLLSGRNLNLPFEVQQDSHTKHYLVTWFTYLSSIIFILFASERIARRFFLQGQTFDITTVLAATFWIFFLTNFALSAVFGTQPSFSFQYAYWALIGYAALLISESDGNAAIRYARNALFFLLIASAVCIPWRPEMVFSAYGMMLLPGLDVRYAGLSSHPNSLAPEAIVFLLCLWSKPYSRQWLTLAGWVIGLVSVLLTQSKTNWLALALCAFCMAYYRVGQGHRDWRLGRSLRSVLLLFSTLGAAIGAGFALMAAGYIDRALILLDTKAGADLLTLLGRTQIWDAAIQEWRNNPLFGYGLNIWNDDHRAQIGLDVVNAHNQFYESLASAGVVGVVGLAVYSVTLLWFALRSAKLSGGLSLALFLLVFTLSLTEVPLSMKSFTAQVIHVLLLMTIISSIASTRGRMYVGGSSHRSMAAPLHSG